MGTQEKNIGGGFRPSSKDIRDFHAAAVFGQLPVEYIPDHDFIVAEPLGIKDQRESDLCTAFATCAVLEDHEDVELSPEWFFAKIKELEGSPLEWGADPRTACKAAKKFGALEKKQAPYSLENEERDFLAEPENWDGDLDGLAYIHHQRSFFRADTGSYDVFDNIRAAMWKHRDSKSSVFTGCMWRPEWTHAKDGIIPTNYSTAQGFGHAFKLFGQKKINGEMYIMAQLSNGTGIGDKGVFYFPREVVNRELTYEAWIFLDADPNEIKQSNWSWWQKVVDWIRKFLKI